MPRIKLLVPRLMIAGAALALASPAYAEVADKLPSLARLWAWATAYIVIALVLEIVRPRLGLIVVAIAAFSGWVGHLEFSDPYVGPAILSELGPGYVKASYGSFAVGLVGPLIIVILFALARKQKKRSR